MGYEDQRSLGLRWGLPFQIQRIHQHCGLIFDIGDTFRKSGPRIVAVGH